MVWPSPKKTFHTTGMKAGYILITTHQEIEINFSEQSYNLTAIKSAIRFRAPSAINGVLVVAREPVGKNKIQNSKTLAMFGFAMFGSSGSQLKYEIGYL